MLTTDFDHDDLSFPHYFHAGTSELFVGTGLGMPGCTYATASQPPSPLQNVLVLEYACVCMLSDCIVFHIIS